MNPLLNKYFFTVFFISIIVSCSNSVNDENNTKEIIVIGLMAEKCVFETLIGGKELGYKMYVIPEAIMGK